MTLNKKPQVAENFSGAGADEHSCNCSRVAFAHAKSTFDVRSKMDGEIALDVEGSFANVVRIGNRLVGMTSDGVGTKVQVAEAMNRFDTLGFDLVAMVADDLAAVGIEPTNISNIIDADMLCNKTIDSLMKGLADASRVARMAITGGEIAELGHRVQGAGKGMHLNWCATAIGVVPETLGMITGAQLTPGDVLVAVREDGFRSNGFTLVRRVLTEKFGENWHTKPMQNGSLWGDAVLLPSRICCTLVTDLRAQGCNLHAAAHITGGGIPGNMGRILRVKELGAVLENPFSPCPAMAEVIAMADLPLEKAYRNFNMGHAMILAMPRSDVEAALKLGNSNGFTMQEVGYISNEPWRVTISVPGVSQTLVFDKPTK